MSTARQPDPIAKAALEAAFMWRAYQEGPELDRAMEGLCKALREHLPAPMPMALPFIAANQNQVSAATT